MKKRSHELLDFLGVIIHEIDVIELINFADSDVYTTRVAPMLSGA